MSQFYGVVKGNRGDASRGGSKKSGMTTNCASWEGQVRCYAYHNKETGTDWVKVTLDTWHGQGQYPPIVLYHGPIGHYRADAERFAPKNSYELHPISLSGGMRL